LLALSPIGWFLLSFMPIVKNLHCSSRMWIAGNTPTSQIIIHIMKVPKWCAKRVHDVVGKSAIYYPHHEVA
jgi:hypothetical protein